MTVQNLFTVYDAKAEAYLQTFQLPTTAMAVRVFAECCNSKDHQFGKHPSDYTLFHLGTFDELNGGINSHAPKSLGNAVEFVKNDKHNDSPSLTAIGGSQ